MKRGFLTHLFILSGICLSLAAGANAQTATDIWALKVGHSWSYAGSFISPIPNQSHSYSITEQITDDLTAFPFPTLKVTDTDPFDPPPSFDWYTVNATELRIWKTYSDDDNSTMLLDTGIIWAKNPLSVGDSWSDSTAGTFTDGLGSTQRFTMTVNSVVESQEIVTVPQGTHNAYKIRHDFLFETTGNPPQTAVNNTWFVPYLGAVKIEDINDEGIYTETLTSATVTLPVDMTFLDVPPTNFAKTFIENLSAAGITGGCSQGPLPQYCPDSSVTRGQMAVFLVVSLGGDPNVCTGQFGDVPAENPFCGFIERLAADGITTGCGNGNFCPDAPVTRAQMAVFIEAALGNAPNTCTSQFSDVLSGNAFCGFVEKLAADGITTGCGNGNFCPNAPVTRAQMAVFLVVALLTGSSPN